MSPHLRGHLLLYDAPGDAANASEPSARLLLVSVLMVVGDVHLQWQDMPMPWAFGALLARLALALVLVRCFAGIEWSAVGFKAFARWGAVERSFLVQVVIIVNVLFPVVHALSLGDPVGTVSASVFLGGSYALVESRPETTTRTSGDSTKKARRIRKGGAGRVESA